MKTTAKLSNRAKLLLWIIDSNTDKNWNTGELYRFFVPKSSAYHYKGFNEQIKSTYISGAGDAAIFRSLEKKELIQRPRSSLSINYIYELTSNGLQVIINEKLREQFSL